MVRQKLDNRIRTLIENGVALGHRSMFAVVGSRAKEQVPLLHHMLSKATVAARPNVLWCYKKDLGFSSHRKKRMRQMKEKARAGNAGVNDDDPFEVFISSTSIRYCYYNETHTILGNTFGMLILQDFEALTPNLLARTIETVEGGGLVVFVLSSVDSLRQLYTLAMDVHSRYRTESATEVVARFNERFILSLAACPACAVVDDALNLLPISSLVAKIEAANKTSAADEELAELKTSLRETRPIGQLLAKCKTLCQGKTLLRLLDAVTEKTLDITCSVTAARGRGKSAALGLAVAGAIADGYSNIFITAPAPDNVRTLFEFVVKGFDALDYQEHTDYDLIQSSRPEWRKALVRINVHRSDHRQCIQYLEPEDAPARLSHAELVVVDEAAAIPLPVVDKIISGPYLVFLASTISGYEGTGRSLSLKLLHQLRAQSAGQAVEKGAAVQKRGRKLFELQLQESIRYRPKDPIENWLNGLLCLEGANPVEGKGNAKSKADSASTVVLKMPPPADCELYSVNRDTLFSYHKSAETFLHRMMGIYASAHYKNSPNDLQLLSDAPSHLLFVLLPPVAPDQTTLPEMLAVLQVCLEGRLSSANVQSGLAEARRASGDLIPWTVAHNLLDPEFATLAGARVVRLAVHPDYQNMGYGTRALQRFVDYLSGRVPYMPPSSKGGAAGDRAAGGDVPDCLQLCQALLRV